MEYLISNYTVKTEVLRFIELHKDIIVPSDKLQSSVFPGMSFASAAFNRRNPNSAQYTEIRGFTYELIDKFGNDDVVERATGNVECKSIELEDGTKLYSLLDNNGLPLILKPLHMNKWGLLAHRASVTKIQNRIANNMDNRNQRPVVPVYDEETPF
jgi:hypothetical protein